MKFNYQAKTQDGRTQTGIVEASNKDAALLILQKYGLYVTYLSRQSLPFYATQVKLLQRTTMRDVVLFSRQLAIMFKAEVSLVEALRSLAEQTGNGDFREKILTLAREIEGGSSFSDALSHFPETFDAFFINMVKSGESAGKLSDVLNYLANHMETEYNLKSRLRGALIYPAMVIIVAFSVFILMIFFVLPNLTQILTETNTKLPLPTKIVISVSNFVRAWWLLMLVGLIAVGTSLMTYIRTENGRKIYDAVLLRMPVMGEVLRKIYLARFAENLSTLISGGLPIAQALDFAGQVIGNVIYKELIFKARDGVRKGEAISSILRQDPYLFPPMFTQMVYVGEKSGSIDRALQNMVTFYQGEVNRTMDNLLSLIEPILIVFLGVIVAVVVAAVLLPLYRLTSA